MLKGHVQIDLHNHETGLKDRIEKDNLITNAVNLLTPFLITSGASLSNELLPLYSRKLGGLMLFNKNLTENVNNIHFPTNAQLVGWAGQTQTFDSDQGSLNTQETGVINGGYKLVWDFATNQANGIIRSIALTEASYDGSYACQPYRTDTSVYGHRLYTEAGASFEGYPICYKDNYLYYLLADSSWETVSTTHSASIYKQYCPVNMLKIADAINTTGNPEFIDSIEIETSVAMNRLFRYASTDEQAGYVYFPYVAQAGEGVDGVIKYRRMSLSSLIDDGEAVLSNEITLNLANIELNDTWQQNVRIVGDKAFALSLDKNTVYVINIADASDAIPVALPGEFISNSYLYNNFLPMSPRGVVSICYVKNEGGANPYKYYVGYIYPDGTFVSERTPYSSSSGSTPQTTNGTTRGTTYISQGLVVPKYVRFSYSDYGTVLYYAPNYLGSICNLSQAIQKTTTTSMKVTYTLTDVAQS